MADTENIWDQIQRDWSDSLPPSGESLANAEKLLHRLKGLDLLPKNAARGYWPTTILTWGDKPLEIEVFESEYELNVHPPWVKGPLFDVHEYNSLSEQSISQLVEKLGSLLK